MTNRIVLSINTEAPYSEDEKDDLLTAFVEWAEEQDGDVDVNSGDIDIVDAMTTTDVSEDRKVEIVQEWLKSANIVATVSIGDDEGNASHSVNLD